MEPDQLSHETHIWIGNLSSLPYVVESFLNSYFLCEYHIAETHSWWSWDTLNTVDVNSSSFLFCLLHEFDNFIETAFNILPYVILQVERQIFDSLVNMVVSWVISSTVDDVCDSVFLKLWMIFCNLVTTQIEEIIENAWAYTIKHCILIHFSRSSLIVEFLIKLFLSSNFRLTLLSSLLSSWSNRRVNILLLIIFCLLRNLHLKLLLLFITIFCSINSNIRFLELFLSHLNSLSYIQSRYAISFGWLPSRHCIKNIFRQRQLKFLIWLFLQTLHRLTGNWFWNRLRSLVQIDCIKSTQL